MVFDLFFYCVTVKTIYWFTILSVSFVIGLSDNFDFGSWFYVTHLQIALSQILGMSVSLFRFIMNFDL